MSISFYGGEPFLEFEKIREIVEYANLVFVGKEIIYNVTTNATVLTDKSLRFIEDNNFNLSISIDGNKYVNDKKRRFHIGKNSVYDKVKAAIEKIAVEYPTLFSKLSINMVMDPSEDFKNYYEIINDIPELSRIRITTNICGDEHSATKNVYTTNFIAGYQYCEFISYLRYFDRYTVSSKDNIFDNDVAREVYSITNSMTSHNVSQVSYPGGPCIPGYRKLFITTNGDMFPCEKLNEKSRIFKIGTVDNGFDYNSIRRLLQLAKITEEQCKKCWAFTLCISCLLNCDGKHRLSQSKRLSKCKEVKSLAEYKLRKYVMYNNIISETSRLSFMEV